MVKEFILVTSGGEFVTTRSPLLDEVLAETCPQIPTILLESLDSPNNNTVTVSTLKQAALHAELECSHFALYSAEHCTDFLTKLVTIVETGCWVILEYCHLLQNSHEILTTIVKVHNKPT